MNELGRFLANARARLQMTVREVEHLSDEKFSKSYVSKLERGTIQNPSPGVLKALAKALKVPYATLLELAGYQAPEVTRELAQLRAKVRKLESQKQKLSSLISEMDKEAASYPTPNDWGRMIDGLQKAISEGED